MKLPTATPLQLAVNALLGSKEGSSLVLSGDVLEEHLQAQGYTWAEAIDNGWMEFERSYVPAGWTITFLGRGMGDAPEWECTYAKPSFSS